MLNQIIKEKEQSFEKMVDDLIQKETSTKTSESIAFQQIQDVQNQRIQEEMNKSTRLNSQVLQLEDDVQSYESKLAEITKELESSQNCCKQQEGRLAEAIDQNIALQQKMMKYELEIRALQLDSEQLHIQKEKSSVY